jgi:AcrR family transcriptional regulator
MQPDARQSENAGREATARGSESERRSLAEIREKARAKPSPLREEIMAATLAASGELGLRRLTVQAVTERYGGYRLQFYQHFASLRECYEEAHAVHLAKLESRLLAASAAAEGWRPGLRAALEELARFVGEDPALARGLLVEVHVAAGASIAQRQEVLERLSRAIDSARRETSGSRHSPPPLTAPFMVSAIEAAVVRALMKGRTEELETALRELEFLVSSAYF